MNINSVKEDPIYTFKKYRRSFRTTQLFDENPGKYAAMVILLLGMCLMLTVALFGSVIILVLWVGGIILLATSVALITSFRNYNIDFPSYTDWVDREKRIKEINNVIKESNQERKTQTKNNLKEVS